MTAQQPPGSEPMVSGTVRAILKRTIAAWRDQPLIDVLTLPPELLAALRPFLRPGMRYLTQPQAHRMIAASCALLDDRQRLARQLINFAKTAASVEMAADLLELVSPGTAAKALPPPDMTGLEAENRRLERQLADLRTTLSRIPEKDG